MKRDMLAFLFRITAETAGVDKIPSLQCHIPSLIFITGTQHPETVFEKVKKHTSLFATQTVLRLNMSGQTQKAMLHLIYSFLMDD